MEVSVVMRGACFQCFSDVSLAPHVRNYNSSSSSQQVKSAQSSCLLHKEKWNISVCLICLFIGFEKKKLYSLL